MKKMNQTILVFLLLFSLLAPNIISLVTNNLDSVVLIESNEEEGKKGFEENLAEKIFFFQNFKVYDQLLSESISQDNFHYSESSYYYFKDILSPPPEYKL